MCQFYIVLEFFLCGNQLFSQYISPCRMLFETHLALRRGNLQSPLLISGLFLFFSLCFAAVSIFPEEQHMVFIFLGMIRVDLYLMQSFFFISLYFKIQNIKILHGEFSVFSNASLICYLYLCSKISTLIRKLLQKYTQTFLLFLPFHYVSFPIFIFASGNIKTYDKLQNITHATFLPSLKHSVTSTYFCSINSIKIYPLLITDILG